jgi:hypothetical protein
LPAFGLVAVVLVCGMGYKVWFNFFNVGLNGADAFLFNLELTFVKPKFISDVGLTNTRQALEFQQSTTESEHPNRFKPPP